MTKLLSVLLLSVLVAACAATSSPTSNVPPAPTGQTVSGTVKDTSGTPVRNATVTLEMTTIIQSAQTDSGGIFRFDNVPAGSYPIKATMSKFSKDSQTVVVTAGAPSTASLIIYRIVPLTPEAGLVCLYRFAGNAVDSSKNHHDGTVRGCTFIADRFGTPGSAIHFSSSASDLVTVPDAPDLTFGGATDYTICFWVETEGSPGRAYAIAKVNLSNSNSAGYYFYESSNYLQAVFMDASNQAASVLINPIQGQVWEFVTVVIDGKRDIATPWINGTVGNPVTSIALSDGIENSYPLTFGYNFLGGLDDIRMYNRALSADEISEIYHERGWR